MNDPTVDWIATIIIGGVAGWLGVFMNIVLGIVGALGTRHGTGSNDNR